MNQQTREESEYIHVDIKADKNSDVLKRGTYLDTFNSILTYSESCKSILKMIYSVIKLVFQVLYVVVTYIQIFDKVFLESK